MFAFFVWCCFVKAGLKPIARTYVAVVFGNVFDNEPLVAGAT